MRQSWWRWWILFTLHLLVSSPTGLAAAGAASAPEPHRLVHPGYPEAARDSGATGIVMIAIQVDAAGGVIGATVVESLGPTFDEAAPRAVRDSTFRPARDSAGQAVAGTVQVSFRFSVPRSREETVSVTESSELNAASAFDVRDRDIQLRPRTRPADLLEVTPGLTVVQHAGGGKANQYFLRGFDLDHGTDLAVSVDGVPVNMVSHGHGQGYADLHYVIPETIHRVEAFKGPYYVPWGDLATAGAVNLVARDNAPPLTQNGPLVLTSGDPLQAPHGGGHPPRDLRERGGCARSPHGGTRRDRGCGDGECGEAGCRRKRWGERASTRWGCAATGRRFGA